MDNQHRQIKGYKELNQADIDAMNAVKEMGAVIGDVIENMKNDPTLDQRWVSIAATDFQTGLMALTRSIAQPGFF